MYKLLLPLLLTGCFEQDPMKVMTYNIKHGELSSLGEIADFIKDEAPDVAALQELDYMTERSGRTAQNEWLGHATGMQPFYFQSDHDFGAGNGFLLGQHVDVLDSYSIPLTTHIDTNPRVIAVVEAVIGYQHYLLINTHLSYIAEDRVVEMVELIDFVKQHTGKRIVLFGDFNQVDRSSVPLVECGPHPSYPSGNPQVAIDAIMVGGLTHMYGSYVVDNRLSDHAAVLAILE